MVGFIKRFFMPIAFILSAYAACGQEKDRLSEAASLHKNYEFEAAIDMYLSAMDSTADSLAVPYIEKSVTECENGANLMRYAATPKTIASKQVSIEDFYLWVDGIADGSWLPIPNPLVKAAPGKFYSAIYFPKNSDRAIFSAPDSSGRWKILQSYRINDTLWTSPEPVSGRISSYGNEIFPFLDREGKTLYFASDAMAGMGGYDLYASRWDDGLQDWGEPENLGFPYSSTSNDLLYFNTPDGKYTIIASDRAGRPDSVGIYITVSMTSPIKRKIESASQARTAAMLEPGRPDGAGRKRPEGDNAEKDGRYGEYSAVINRINILRDDYSAKLDKLRESREIYAGASGADREFLAEMIADIEKESFVIKKQLDSAGKAAADMEMEFLKNGIIPQIPEEEDYAETVRPTAPYRFVKHKAGIIPNMAIELPEVKSIITDGIPDGLVYQIQIAVLSSPAEEEKLNGLVPVYVTKQPSGNYLHAVGAYRTYSQASSNLKGVRAKGFPKAFIIAYENGESISVKTARALENKPAEYSYNVTVYGYSDGLPEQAIEAVRSAYGDKDITEILTGDGPACIIGPFPEKRTAENAAELLRGMNVENVSVQSIKL